MLLFQIALDLELGHLHNLEEYWPACTNHHVVGEHSPQSTPKLSVRGSIPMPLARIQTGDWPERGTAASTTLESGLMPPRGAARIMPRFSFFSLRGGISVRPRHPRWHGSTVAAAPDPIRLLRSQPCVTVDQRGFPLQLKQRHRKTWQP